ncbi:hypothetical protein [Treponema zioleckii]|uniref:hypothetical protein n=1 Tax=Treponema zioleckii TaxID=331680 RepID=UPI00168B79BF|nr:hypothetical protein [Treponema zioleckii]
MDTESEKTDKIEELTPIHPQEGSKAPSETVSDSFILDESSIQNEDDENDETDFYEELESAKGIPIPFLFLSKKNFRPLLFRLTRRSVFLLFFLLLAFSTYFVIGNFQHFLDSNLRAILFMITLTSIVLVLDSFIAIIQSIIFFFTEKRIFFAIYIIFFVFLIVFSSAIGIIAISLKSASEGF